MPRTKKSAVPAKLSLQRQKRALMDATLLLQDEFWAQIAEGYHPRVALFAYCVLSGATEREALALVNENRRSLHWNTHKERLLHYYQDLSRPIITRAMMAANISPFWMARVIRSVGDNPATPPELRLKAVELAARISGITPAADRGISTYPSQDPLVQRTLQEEISMTIRRTIGSSITIPQELPEPTSQEAFTVVPLTSSLLATMDLDTDSL